MPRLKGPAAAKPTPSLNEARIDRSSDIGPQIYELVRQSIILNELEPGAVVNEVDICEWFGVSRTPIREAYKKLIEDGLIKSMSKVGSRVSEIDNERVREGILIRRALEREVIGLICEKKPDLKRLDGTLAMQQVAVNHNDQPMFFREDERFHAILADLAGIPSAWRLAHSVKAHADRARIRLNRDDPQRMVSAFEQHQALVVALKVGNASLSRELIDTHVNSVFAAIGGEFSV